MFKKVKVALKSLEELDVQMGHATECVTRDWTSIDSLEQLSIKAKRFSMREEKNDDSTTLHHGEDYVVKTDRIVRYEATGTMSVMVSIHSLVGGDAIALITNGDIDDFSFVSQKEDIVDSTAEGLISDMDQIQRLFNLWRNQKWRFV